MFIWFKETGTFNRGDSFGQNAFITSTNPKKVKRDKTIQAKEKSGLAVLSRDDFTKVLKKVKVQ